MLWCGASAIDRIGSARTTRAGRKDRYTVYPIGGIVCVVYGRPHLCVDRGSSSCGRVERRVSNEAVGQRGSARLKRADGATLILFVTGSPVLRLYKVERCTVFVLVRLPIFVVV